MQFSGIQAYAAYGVLIIQQIFPEYANLIPMLFNLLPIITGLMTACLLARIGRKPILQFGTSFTILALLLTAIGYFIISTEEDNEGAKILILIGYFIFMIMFGLSQGPLIFLYVPQIVDPKFISIATFANWATAAVISISFPILSNAFGTPAPIFTFFAVWCFVSLVFNQKVMVETKGKTEKEIYDEFDEIVSCN